MATCFSRLPLAMEPPRSDLSGCYSIHDTYTAVSWDDPSVASTVHAILDYFGFTRLEAMPSPPDMQISFLTRGPAPVVPEDASLVAQYNGVDVLHTETHYYLCEGDSVVQLDLASGTGWGVLRSPLLHKPGVVRIAAVNLVIHSVLLLLRRRAFYPLHAAALAKDGVGFLFVAESDAGKSTLALSLVREGWHYLSDDSILLQPGVEHVEARPLRRDFGMDQDAARAFPEIAAHWQPFLTDERKRRIHMAALYPSGAVDRCVPRVLVFPKIVDQPESRLTPVSKKKALFSLMHQSAFLMLEPRMAAAHLEVLNRLTNQTDGYELLAGRDLKREPALISRLLGRILLAPSGDAGTPP